VEPPLPLDVLPPLDDPPSAGAPLLLLDDEFGLEAGGPAPGAVGGCEAALPGTYDPRPPATPFSSSSVEESLPQAIKPANASVTPPKSDNVQSFDFILRSSTALHGIPRFPSDATKRHG
jgi:hypothetical protein